MGTDELEAMAARLALEAAAGQAATTTGPAAAGEGAPAAAGAVASGREAPAALVQLCAVAVEIGGTIITTRAGVAPLTPDEVGQLAAAVAGVAAQYEITELDPKVAAWGTLALTLGGVALPRLEERRRTIEHEPPPSPGNDDDQPPPPPGVPRMKNRPLREVE